MTGIANMIATGTLNPTTKWKYRGFSFVRLPGMTRTTLTIMLGDDPESVADCRTYDVEEGAKYRENREFLLNNRNNGNIYTVVIGRNAGCNCKAGLTQKRCIHREVMTAALAVQDNEGLES